MHSKAIEAGARAIAASDTNPDSGIKCLWHVESYRNTVTKHAQAAIAAYLAAMEAEGVVLVPVEPTQEMVEAGEDWQAHCGDCDTLYSAMLSARPNVKG